MWQHNYAPVLNSLGWSTLAAAVPIFVLLLLIGVLRKPAWIAGLSGLAAGLVVAIGVYGMPVKLAASSTLMGAAFGLLPIAWIVYWAVVLYRLTLETGNFEIIKDSIGGLTADRRLQAMLIAFAFGAFIEGAAGFGTPVAVAAAMLTGLGFSPFFAAGICLLANTAPVAFGSIGIPVIRSRGTTGIPVDRLSAWVGRHLRAGLAVHSRLPDSRDGRLSKALKACCRRRSSAASASRACSSSFRTSSGRSSSTSWPRSRRSSASSCCSRSGSRRTNSCSPASIRRR